MPRIVLVNPEIPPNTGNIARTCAATGTELHLIEPLGFELSDKYLKRAGLDYWQYVPLTCHTSFEDFARYSQELGGRWIGFSTRGRLSYTQIEYREDDWLIYGKETSGLSPEVCNQCSTLVRIPMGETGVRSLNLSVSVAVGLFESRRQLGYLNEP
ncbi:MAG: tRNA (cytidine(34)-2'-O)-methyltransferase [Cyanobacteria bacterium]|nr:tRNA (cytidine(34)-2'-O)-methyltransferase [Cyanobacteriota bacterium]